MTSRNVVTFTATYVANNAFDADSVLSRPAASCCMDRLSAETALTGGKESLGSISKQGNRHLRWLLVAGAMAVIRYGASTARSGCAWLV
jgi:transposase